MKHPNNIFLKASLLLALVSLLSCSDFFIKEIEIPRQDLDDQLVVHGFISDIDTIIHFVLAKNYPLEENTSDISETWIDGATISVEMDGNPLFDFDIEDKLYIKELDEPIDGAGKNFRIDITHPDFESAYIETEMPAYVAPSSVKFLPEGGFSGGPGGGNKQNAIEVIIKDPPNEKNYYEIQVNELLVSSETKVIFGDTSIFETVYPNNFFIPDPNFTQGISGFLLSDELFNGEEYTFNIHLIGNVPLDEIPLDRLKITWNCVSRDHFEFSNSIIEHKQSTSFGLFTDPIAVYSNVKNGLGIISLRSSREIIVEQ